MTKESEDKHGEQWTPDDIIGPFDPHQYMVNQFWNHPENRGDVLFSPNTATVWQAMARMSDVARTFIFCLPSTKSGLEQPSDWIDECPAELRSCFSETGEYTGSAKTLEGNPPLEVPLNASSVRVAYRKLTRMIPDSGDSEKRVLYAFFFFAEPVASYTALFPSTADGPKFLCLRGAGWDGTALKTAIDNGEVASPRYIIGEKNHAYSEWSYPWQAYALWEGCTAYQRRQTPDHQTRPPADCPGFTLVNQMLRPANVPEGFGVHITLDEYMKHGWSNYWDGPIFLDCADAARVAEIHADHPVGQLCIRGKPLGEALNNLSETLSQLDPVPTGVCTARLGFEDEAGCMSAVWQQIRLARNHQRTLRVYCENEIDAAAVRGFVCGAPRLP